MDGADGRARGHDFKISQRLFDRIVGQERDPVVGPEPALAQQGGEAADVIQQRAIADDAAIIGRNQPRLIGIAPGRAHDPIVQ